MSTDYVFSSHDQLNLNISYSTTDQEILRPAKQCRGGAAVKECGRIFCTTFLSLLPPLSLLLVSRLSAARYFSSPTSLLLQSKTAAIFSLLVSAVAIAALLQGLTTGKKPYFLASKRRRLYGAWILLCLMQICLRLGIHATADVVDVDSYGVGNVALPRRLILFLGLHEMVVFWRRNVVEPVVDEAVLGFPGGGFRWVEKAALAAAFGYLWWRRLRDEAEVLAVMPRIRAEREMEVEVADFVGWFLYYPTAAIGGVRVVKGLLWVVSVSENKFRRIQEQSN